MEYLLALRWLLLYALLSLAGLPLAATLFPRFPDRGASFALPVTLATMGLAAFWIGHVAFGPAALLGGLGAVLALDVVAVRRGVEVDRRRSVEALAVFAVAFALLVAMRAAQPGIVPEGGEKFLDFGLLKSLLRADALPPADPWFAGETVRYYYGGPLLASLLAKLAGTPARYAYDLALAGFYGALVTAAYGLAGAIGIQSSDPGRSADRVRRRAGLLGAFLVGFAGTLATPGRLLLGLLPRSLAEPYGHLLLDGLRMEYGQALTVVSETLSYAYWWGRYVVPDSVHLFPMWAFRNGDLNAYMVATPFLLLAAACAYAYVRTPEDALARRRALVFGVLPAVAGHLATVSTWSLPTAVGLTWLALAFADAGPATLLPAPVARRLEALGSNAGRLARELGRTGLAILLAIPVGALAVAWAAPYLLFETPTNRGIGLFPPRSGLGGLLLVYGVFLVPFALSLAPRVRPLVAGHARWLLAAGGVALAVLLAVLAFVVDLAAVALLGPFLVAGWLLARLDADVGFETVLLVAGCGLLLIVEFAYARVWPFDPAAPHWNTVYKVSMQVWVLWGTATAAALTRLLGGPGASRVEQSTGTRSWSRRAAAPVPAYRPAATAAVALLLVASAIFPVVALVGGIGPAVLDPGSATIDGWQYAETNHTDEVAAIEWLDDRPGQPTMVSRPGEEMYTWVNGPASLTGVPTLAGWEHEAGYRGERAYRTRVRDVELVYTAPRETASAVLRRYDVDLVYVGPNEREAYGTRNFARYDGLSEAFSRGNVTIYRVNRTALPG